MKRQYLCIYLPQWREDLKRVLGAKSLKSDPFGDFALLCKLARWSTRFAPLVAIDDDLVAAYRSKTLGAAGSLHNGLILDITGTQRLFKGDRRLASDVSRRFLRKSVTARIAIAPTIGAAWAFSRFSHEELTIIAQHTTSNELEPLLAPLPPESLRIPEETSSALSELGLKTIADLLILPRHTLTPRFGPLLLCRIEQALGRREEALHFMHFDTPLTVARRFEVPLINQESIKISVLNLLKKLFELLMKQGKKARSFLIDFRTAGRENSRSIIKEISLYSASASFLHVSSIIQPLVESIQTPDGIAAIIITARFADKSKKEQINLSPEIASGDPLTSSEIELLLNHFVTQLGRDNVTKLVFKESYIPERSFSYQPLLSPQSERSQPVSILSENRPPYLFPKPEPINATALLPDRAPAQIKWQNRLFYITHAGPPERIGDEWWHSVLNGGEAYAGRDYFKVQDHTGRWLWLFRDQDTLQWFVHGLWI